MSEQEFYQVSCNPQTFWVKPSTEAEVKQRLLKFVLYQGISTPYQTLIRSILEYGNYVSLRLTYKRKY